MTILITVATLCVLSYIGYSIVGRYMAATGTASERLWAAVSGSATVAVSYASAALSGIVALLYEVPEVKEHLQSVVPADKWPYFMLVTAVLSYLARRRTL
jgi:F0F1-type ATP synthase membrane subunit a